MGWLTLSMSWTHLLPSTSANSERKTALSLSPPTTGRPFLESAWTSLLGSNKSFHHLLFTQSLSLPSSSHFWGGWTKTLKTSVVSNFHRPSWASHPYRQWYLYNKIHEFCCEESKVTTCPRPSVPELTAARTTSASSTTLYMSVSSQATGSSATTTVSSL